MCRTLYFTDLGETPSVSAVVLNSTPATRRFVVADDIVSPNGLSLDPHGKIIVSISLTVKENAKKKKKKK